MTEHRIRCGDHVRHEPSGWIWVVAWADYETGELACCGWPNGIARIEDCTLVTASTDEEHRNALASVIITGGSRAERAARLYGGGNG